MARPCGDGCDDVAGGLLDSGGDVADRRGGRQGGHGSDAGVGPHGENLRELPLMVKAGMTPGAVLRAATLEAARLLGVDDQFGTVEVGKLADLVVVTGDPYEFEDIASRIDQVWKAGQRVV
jgi:imidazolonepropionase-like amidohydrolase